MLTITQPDKIVALPTSNSLSPYTREVPILSLAKLGPGQLVLNILQEKFWPYMVFKQSYTFQVIKMINFNQVSIIIMQKNNLLPK